MRLAALIEILQTRLKEHGDLDVQVTFEGVSAEIVPDSFYVDEQDKKSPLYIDLDGDF